MGLTREVDLRNKNLQMEKLKLETELQKEQERADDAESDFKKTQQFRHEVMVKNLRSDDREKTHRNALIKTLSENEGLRAKVSEFEDAIKTLYQDIDDKSSLIAEKDKLIEQIQMEKRGVENEVEEQKHILLEREAEIATINDELSAVGELEEEIKETISAKVSKWKAIVNDLQAQLKTEREKRLLVEKKNDGLLQENRNNDTSERLVQHEEATQPALKDLVGTQNLLAESRQELHVLMQENETLKTEQGNIVDLAIEKYQQEIQHLSQLLSEKNAELAEEKAQYKEMYEEKYSMEKQIHDCELTLTEYEKDHGLTEARIKQNQLKGDIV